MMERPEITNRPGNERRQRKYCNDDARDENVSHIFPVGATLPRKHRQIKRDRRQQDAAVGAQQDTGRNRRAGRGPELAGTPIKSLP
jgi:hypothetical protein